MGKQFEGFILPWKDIADVDDFLAAQTDRTVREIRARFERKQEESPCARDVLGFQLGIVLYKKELLQKDKSIIPYVCIEIGLSTSGSANPKLSNYRKAASLLKAALWESATTEVEPERVEIKFRRYSRSY